MTPERAKWRAELPKEEKRVRLEIKEHKRKIKWIKEELPHSFGHYGEAIKDGLRRNKILINVLRKQIAMRPFRKEFGLFCPTCKDCLGVGWLHIVKTPHCSKCGQKLRW